MKLEKSARGRAIESISEAFGCSIVEAQAICERIEKATPCPSHESICLALDKLKGTDLADEVIIRAARAFDELAEKKRIAQLKAKNAKVLRKRSKRWRPDKRVRAGKMSRRKGIRPDTGVKHWRG
jgi:predicted RNA-binding protein with PUA domain